MPVSPSRERCVRLLVGLLAAILCVSAASAFAAAAASPFDLAILEADLARAPQADAVDALQAHFQRLADAYTALDAATLPPTERKAIGDRILARMGEVGLLLRTKLPAAAAPSGARGGHAGWGLALAGWLPDASAWLIAVVGGLVICFALGGLVGYRRGSREGSYYYADADPRMRFVTRAPAQADPRLPPPRVTLEQIRERLRVGQRVLLQLGYEIDPAQRVRFMTAMAKMQDVLRDIEDHTFAVWEDPRHPNRFYECLECRDVETLDRLMAVDGPLPRLVADVEACRPRNGWIVRRAWWGVGGRPGRRALTRGTA
jgi:hypothetical protein